MSEKIQNKILQVVEVIESQDVNGKNFRQVWVQTLPKGEEYIPGVGKVLVTRPVKRASYNAWESNYLPTPQKDEGYDVAQGQYIYGDIVTVPTTPYEVRDRMVNSYTFVVLGETNNPSWDALVVRAFQRKMSGRTNPVYMLDEDGNPIGAPKGVDILTGEVLNEIKNDLEDLEPETVSADAEETDEAL